MTQTNLQPSTDSAPTSESRRSSGFAGIVSLVAEREIRMRLRSKAFLISTAILLVVTVASILLGGILGGTDSKPPVAAVGSVARSLPPDTFKVTPVDSRAAGEALLRAGDVDAVIVPSDSPTKVAVIGLDSAPSKVISKLSVAPSVQLLNPDAPNPFLIYIVALGFGIIFFISAMTFGGQIAQSVVEEKQTRVVEILISAIPVRTLLAGKVIGNSLLAFGQIIAISACAGVAMAISGQGALLAGIGPAIIWFIVFFTVGFVLLASMFAAAASLVSRQEDVQSVISPVTMLVMIPYFLVIFFNDNALVLGIMSYVPFSAPVGMPMRIFLGSAQWWEPLLSLLLSVVVTIGVIMVGARIYQNSLLRTGGRVKVKEALRG